MLPFLIRYSSRSCQLTPPGGIQCPPELVNACAINSLAVIPTVTDGNCGVDAFRLVVLDASNTSVALHDLACIKSLKKAGGASEQISHLRKKAVAWMAANRTAEMWEGMTFEFLALAMSQSSTGYAQHLQNMSEDKSWIDASVLHALGCVFKVNVVITQSNSDPAFVGFSLSENSPAPHAYVTVALHNDRHFWATSRVQERFAIVPYDNGDFLQHHLAVNSATDLRTRKNQAASDSESDGYICTAPDVTLSPYDLDEDTACAELDMILAMRDWNAFDEPQPDLVTALQRLAACYAGSPTQHEHMCLVRQQAWLALSAESQGAARLPPESEYRGSLRWRLRRRQVVSVGHGGKSSVTAHMLRVHGQITHEVVEKALQRECCHEKCIATFAANVSTVRNWRLLWHSAPANAKHEMLMDFIRRQYEEYQHNPINEFRIKYRVLGVDVCRPTFIAVTGIGCSFITACRKDVLDGRKSYHVMYDNCFEGEGGPRSNQRTATYLDARAWIVEYARTHASQSPITGSYELPAGRKLFYHACYRWDREQKKMPAADISNFRAAWRMECPHIKITTSTNKFTQCGLCSFLRRQMDLCPRSNQSLLQSLRSRLGAHFNFQSAQRVKVDEIAERCRQSGGNAWFFTIDKMDQTATIMPTIWSQLSSPLFKLGSRLVCGVVGSEWAGPSHTQMLLRSVFQDVSGGSETQCSIVLTNLLHVARREGRLPLEVVMNPDNTPKESKHQYMLHFQMWLLCVLRDTCFYSFSTVFLIVGHTHNALDRFFSRLVVALRGCNYDTIDDMWEIITNALNAFDIQVCHTKQTWAFKELSDKNNAAHLPSIAKLHFVHAVNIFRMPQGIFMKWKQYVTDEIWSTPVCIVQARQMRYIAARPVQKRFSMRDEMLAWLGKYTNYLADMQGSYNLHKQGIQWLEKVIKHEHQEFNDNTPLEHIINELVHIGESQGRQPHAVPCEIPDDQIVALFPGADLPNVPVETLVQVEGIWPQQAPPPVPIQGRLVICQALGMNIGDADDDNDNYYGNGNDKIMIMQST